MRPRFYCPLALAAGAAVILPEGAAHHTRDVLRRCDTNDSGEGTTCWPAPESTDNMNTKFVGRLGLSDEEENDLVSFMQTLTDGFMQR